MADGSAAPTDSLLSNADVIIQGDDFLHEAGAALAVVGDVDQDNVDDLLIGTPGDSNGQAVLFYGGSMSTAMNAADGDVFVYSAGSADAFGAALGAAGDVNGDTYDDILIGAPLHDLATGTDQGAAYLILSVGL